MRIHRTLKPQHRPLVMTTRRPPNPVTFLVTYVPSIPFASLTLFLLKKLTSAAPRGDAALTYRPGNPLLALATRQNVLDVEIYDAPVLPLIDTGTHLSVMSAHLFGRLREVVTPTGSPVRVADG